MSRAPTSVLAGVFLLVNLGVLAATPPRIPGNPRGLDWMPSTVEYPVVWSEMLDSAQTLQGRMLAHGYNYEFSHDANDFVQFVLVELASDFGYATLR